MFRIRNYISIQCRLQLTSLLRWFILNNDNEDRILSEGQLRRYSYTLKFYFIGKVQKILSPILRPYSWALCTGITCKGIWGVNVVPRMRPNFCLIQGKFLTHHTVSLDSSCLLKVSDNCLICSIIPIPIIFSSICDSLSGFLNQTVPCLMDHYTIFKSIILKCEVTYNFQGTIQGFQKLLHIEIIMMVVVKVHSTDDK